MSAGTVIVIIVVCAAVAGAAVLAALLELRLAMLRRQFGPEYDRLARQSGHRHARAELLERKRRVAALGIRPLTPEQHARYAGEWAAAQEDFVERPAEALATAAALVKRVARERGYRAEDRGQAVADLSVSHARRLDAYRRAEEVAEQAGTASTEDLRQAMLWYRAMFRDLAEPGERAGQRLPAGLARAPRLSRAPRLASVRLPRLRGRTARPTHRPPRRQETSAHDAVATPRPRAPQPRSQETSAP